MRVEVSAYLPPHYILVSMEWMKCKRKQPQPKYKLCSVRIYKAKSYQIETTGNEREVRIFLVMYITYFHPLREHRY